MKSIVLFTKKDDEEWSVLNIFKAEGKDITPTLRRNALRALDSWCEILPHNAFKIEEHDNFIWAGHLA